MGLFGIFKSKSAPDELPELVTDEMEESLEPVKKDKKTPLKNDIDFKPIIESSFEPEPIEEIGFKPTSLHPRIKPKHHKHLFQEKIIEKKEAMDFNPEESYFSELKENIDKEIDNIDELEDWYKKKFVTRDIVKDMKRHWEGKKNNTVIKMLSKNFQERISEKTKNLKDLEKEWQNIFNMVEKEEEIKEQEKELKMMLADFVEICKRKSKENEEEKEED
jgi:molybdopterin converting factor small subunit